MHLVDATYELFRAFFGAPARSAPDGAEVGAVRGLLASMLYLLGTEGATHVGCAADTVIESFRNGLYSGYKTGAGVAPELMAQFPLAEEALRALGLVVWGMLDFEADDALATAAHRLAADPAVEQVIVATPDKDLAQVVTGARVVLLDRRQKKITDEAGVHARWGVAPASIPDWLALVGDSADGFPGVPGWGEKSASTVLAAQGRIEDIPDDARLWKARPRGAERLAAALAAHREDAALFKVLATLRLDAPVPETLGELEWRGATPAFRPLCARLGFVELPERVGRWQG